MTKLTDRALRALKPGDPAVTDGVVKGLRFTPTPAGGKWDFRFVSPVTGKRREAGLGAFPSTALSDARERATAMRRLLDEGKDPLEERDRAKAAVEKDSKVPTFGAAAKQVHSDLKAGWRPGKNVKLWLACVETHLAAILDRRVDGLTPADFADALRAEWMTKPRATADALQRSSVIMRWCFAHGFVSSDPTTLVRSLLPKQDTSVQHHPAMPWKSAPAFVRTHLSEIGVHEVVRACLYVQLLTACRPGEARGMRWSEVDLDAARWTVPAARMKAATQHVVPLPSPVVALLRRMEAEALHDDFVFPNTRGNAPIADVRLQEAMQQAKVPSDVAGRHAVPHGNRATFRNWCADHGHDERTAERQLAHKPKGQTAQAYERSNQIERRALLMAQWADFLHAPGKRDLIAVCRRLTILQQPDDPKPASAGLRPYGVRAAPLCVCMCPVRRAASRAAIHANGARIV